MAVGPMSPSMCQNWEVVLWEGRGRKERGGGGERKEKEGGGRKERGGGRGVEGQGY